MKAIDRNLLIRKYIDVDIAKFNNSDVKIVLENLKQNILKMPAIDRPQGKWTNAGLLAVHCSNCKSEFHGLEAMNYCPNCGAKMKGEDDE